MSDGARLWNSPLLRSRKPRPPERIWSMRKNVKQVDAELRGHGEYGWEIQFFHDGEFAYGRRWTLHAQALAEADDKRRELTDKGWTLIHE